jgi:microcystin-dependent protein
MKAILKSVFGSFAVTACLIAQLNICYAQAGLLQMGVQQFFDANGNPLSLGKVYTYIPGTTTNKTTWQDSGEVNANTNPITLNAAGYANTATQAIYGQGTYRLIVKDQNNNLIWDAVTQPGGVSASATLIGDGQPVGTIKPFAGVSPPAQYLFSAGQALSRSTYSDLYTAVTIIQAVNCSTSSAVITGLTDTTNIGIGSTVELSCLAAGHATVSSKTGSTITLSATANATVGATATFFPWGNGDGSTTFNLPDLRGVALVGRTNMDGSLNGSSNLTSTYYLASPNGQGVVGGGQSFHILQANLPNVSFTHSGTTLTNPSHTHGYTVSNITLGGGGVGSNQTAAQSTGGTPTTGTQSANPSINAQGSAASGGSDTPISVVQPSVTMNYVIKVTSDISAATTNGVASIQGMTGVITCGTGMTCTGNVISASAGGGAGGLDTQVQFNSVGAFAGSANLTWVSPTLTIGLAGSATGQLALGGATSGTAIIASQAANGSPTLTLPTATGTFVTTAVAPLSINAGTGAISLATPVTGANGGTGVANTGFTITLGGNFVTSGAFATTLTVTGVTNSTLPSGSHTLAALDLADQTLSGGANVTAASLGTKSSGTLTIDCGTSPLQFYTNGGAHILAAPVNDGSCIVKVLNNGSAGTITFSGFACTTCNTGDPLTLTNTSSFNISIWRINSVSRYVIAANQ